MVDRPRFIPRKLLFAAGLLLAGVAVTPVLPERVFINRVQVTRNGINIGSIAEVCLDHRDRDGIDIPGYSSCGSNILQASARYIPVEVSRVVFGRTP